MTTREFHYIVTLTFNNQAGGSNTYTLEGVYTAFDTRRDRIYQDVISHVRTKFGMAPAQQYSVLFYSLEPLRVDTKSTPPPSAPAIVERTFKDPDHLEFGAYRVYWKGDPTHPSIAAIGQDSAGRYWLAPTNWISVPTFDWSGVERVELIAKWPEDRANTTAEENR